MSMDAITMGVVLPQARMLGFGVCDGCERSKVPSPDLYIVGQVSRVGYILGLGLSYCALLRVVLDKKLLTGPVPMAVGTPCLLGLRVLLVLGLVCAVLSPI